MDLGKTAYWTSTSLLAAGLSFGGLSDLTGAPAVMEVMHSALMFTSWALRPASRRLGWLWRGWRMRTRFAVTSALLLATLPGGCTTAEAHAASHEASEVVAFWREAGPSLWFAKDDAFDRRFRERFLALYQAAARGDLGSWSSTSEGTLALVILLDQFPRNAFRGTPRMYASDGLARAVAERAIRERLDQDVEPGLRAFLYLPFGHSEDLNDQERSVELNSKLGEPHLSHARGHRDIIKRFGRFPHRNPILGRTMRPAEQQYLDQGGFKG